MRKILSVIKELLYTLFGTTLIDEFYWRFRHLFDQNDWAKLSLSPEKLEGPEMARFMCFLKAHPPFESALEIGCAAGQNLIALARQVPDLELYGLDISPHAIKYGKEWLRVHAITNISLSVGEADNLSRFPNKSIDLVFTNAVLFYVGPENITRVVKEMLRVAKQSIVLVEWNTDQSNSVYTDHWAHNWKKLFRDLGEENIRLTKLDPDPWNGHGYVVGVSLKPPA